MSARAIRRIALALLSLCAAGACDLEAGPDQELVLGNRGLVVAFERPNAVTVRPGGSLVVQDADVIGRGFPVGLDPRAPFITPGEAIVSNGGRVRIVRGHVSAGSIVVLAANGAIQNGVAPPALRAMASDVEILGGTFATSAVIAAQGVTPFLSIPASTTIAVSDSELRIRGGTVASGVGPFAGPLSGVRSDVEISGGDFGPGSVILAGSTSRITGGKIDRLQLFPDIVSPTPPFQFGPGCTEIRGGVLNRVHVQGPGERLIVFGTSFDRALGPIEAPPPSDPPMVLEPPVTTPLSGVLESGEPIGFELSISSMTQVSLAAPGDPGCPQSGR